MEATRPSLFRPPSRTYAFPHPRAAHSKPETPTEERLQIFKGNGILRRHLSAGTLTALLSGFASPSHAVDVQIDRSSVSNELDAEITQKVVFDVGMCEDSTRINRSLGEKRFCVEVAPLGSLTFGLFGNRLPITVSNFIQTIEAGAYNETIFNRIISGEFLAAGKQGSRRLGEVEAPRDLQSNPELTTAKAFALTHVRPGTLSLAIAENEDPTERTLSTGYHPTQFLITTGPGPVPQLDNGNVVFGRIVDGFDTLALLAEVRTYKPSSRIRAFNAFATAIGDERAAEVRKTWGRPIQPIVITSARVLPA